MQVPACLFLIQYVMQTFRSDGQTYDVCDAEIVNKDYLYLNLKFKEKQSVPKHLNVLILHQEIFI